MERDGAVEREQGPIDREGGPFLWWSLTPEASSEAAEDYALMGAR